MQMAVNNGVINQINSKSAPLNESARSPRSNKLNSASLSDPNFFQLKKSDKKKRGNTCIEIQIPQNHGRYMRKVNI